MIIAVLTVLVLFALATTMGVTLYDVREINRATHRQSHPYARRYRNRPLVSVVIYASSNALWHSLDSVAANRYKKLEIFAAGSESDRAAVAVFARQSKRKILFTSTPAEQVDGDIVVVMRGGTVLGSQAITRIVQRFNTNPAVHTLLPYRSAGPSYSVVSLMQEYRQFLGNLLQKARSASGLWPTEYAPDVVAYGQQTDIFRRDGPPAIRYPALAAWLRAVFIGVTGWVTLALPPLLGYFVFMAVQLHEPTMLMISWAAFGLALLFAIWWDDQLGWWQKISYSLLLPVTFLPLYLLSFWSALKLLANVRKAKVPRSVGFFVRVKDQLRIVK